jgi:hypothetical protein
VDLLLALLLLAFAPMACAGEADVMAGKVTRARIRTTYCCY